MSFFSRISNVFKAKAESTIASAEKENAIELVKLEIVDDSKAVLDFEKSVAQIGGQKISLAKEVEVLEVEVEKWGSRAELADSDELALQSFERQEEAEENLKITKTNLVARTKDWDKYKDLLTKQKKIVQQKKRQISVLESRHQAAKLNKKMQEKVSQHAGSSGVSMDKLNMLKENTEDMENSAQAQAEINESDTGSNLESKFAELESKSSAKDKLAAMKAKRKKTKK